MIRVTVELVPGGVGRPRTIASAEISNVDWFNETRGSYRFAFRGKNGKVLKYREGELDSFPRLSRNVWYLIYRCLKEAGFR